MTNAFIIAYDICSPSRLQKVYRTLCRYGTPIEFSVFLVCVSEALKTRCLQELLALIAPKEDDLRCYPLPLRGIQHRIGKACLPAGIHWTGLPDSKILRIGSTEIIGTPENEKNEDEDEDEF